ncbi:Riboflavin biosynthesis protein RibF [uncultured Paludibacter sp.]|uniref:Riboflavin biosynthesis protein n=1 Tax=uncultured Paludibacter sp. TaxID=497635 RepID=A0A653AFF3_9BACT|nr:Riboflavin biosynthesis protein RibF [uncultured Paludibacter sp.]
MYIFKQNDIIPWEGCVATVGFFDGVHAGHRFLLEELKNIAKENHLNSLVVTFDKHPRKVLNANFQPKLLTTLNEKIEQFETTGVDACLILDFSKEFAFLTAYEFMKYVLVERLKVKILLVGHDHRFGYNREQGFDDYVKIGDELGVKVIEVAQFGQEENPHISSSEIRHALENGKIEKANEILTYPYSFSGKIIKGNQLGRYLGFPTANIKVDEKDKIIPKIGVYGVRVTVNGKSYKGMMNIGYRPTVEFADDVKIEVNIIDFEGEIYNKTIKIEVLKHIREEKKFKNLNELKIQLQKDREMMDSLS